MWASSRRKNQKLVADQPREPPSSNPTKWKIFLLRHRRRLRTSQDTSCSEEESDNSTGGPSWATWRVGNIIDAPPTQSDWWREVEASSGDSNLFQDDSRFTQKRKKFYNCGLETWKIVREEWRKQTVERQQCSVAKPSKADLAKGLLRNSSNRTYQLPHKMALSDLVETYQMVWNSQD